MRPEKAKANTYCFAQPSAHATSGIDPDTAERDREIPGWVVKTHAGMAGVYAAVLTEGIVRPGDAIAVVD